MKRNGRILFFIVQLRTHDHSPVVCIKGSPICCNMIFSANRAWNMKRNGRIHFFTVQSRKKLRKRLPNKVPHFCPLQSRENSWADNRQRKYQIFFLIKQKYCLLSRLVLAWCSWKCFKRVKTCHSSHPWRNIVSLIKNKFKIIAIKKIVSNSSDYGEGKEWCGGGFLQ